MDDKKENEFNDETVGASDSSSGSDERPEMNDQDLQDQGSEDLEDGPSDNYSEEEEEGKTVNEDVEEQDEEEDEVPLTFRGAAVSIYDFLVSMKTAVTLLIIVGILSFIGAIIPQEKIDPSQVQALATARPTLASIYRFLGFFDIYHTVYYLSLLALIVTSLAFCQIPRIKKTWNRTMKPRFFPNDDFYKKFKNTATIEVKDSFVEVKDEVRRILRSRLFKVRVQEETDSKFLIDASKMRWGAFGSLVFHFSFLVFGFGVVYGILFGFNGYLEIIERDTGYVKEANFTQVRAQGAFFRGHRDFSMYLSEFNVTRRPDGSPRGFISHVTIHEEGKPIVKSEVRMNRPLDRNGYRLFQQSYGYAPDIKLFKAGQEPIVDRPIKFFFGNDQNYGWSSLNFPNLNNLAYTMFVVPTNQANNPGPAFIDICAQEGEIQNDQQGNTSCSDLPAVAAVPEAERAVTPHKTFEGRAYEGDEIVIGQYKFEFKQMLDYTGLNVVFNPGIPIIYFGFALGSLAILVSLYIHERRIWAIIRPNGKHTEILIGGLSARNMVQFTQEFNAIVDEIGQVARGKRT